MSDQAVDNHKENQSAANSTSPLRTRTRLLVSSKPWERFITVLIVINAVILGLETAPSIMARIGSLIERLDEIILGIFVIEIALRIYAHGWRFWRDPWSVFDFLIVSIALVPTTGDLSILRAFRILRALRLVSTVGSMRRVVSGLLRALPGMGSIILLLGLFCYVFAVMGTKLFGAHFPELFGTVGHSTYTLFQIMTLDGWSSEVVRPVMKIYPSSWIFFMVFILVTAFTVLNLFIGIIVDALQTEHEEENESKSRQRDNNIRALVQEMQHLRKDIEGLKQSPLMSASKLPPDTPAKSTE